MAGREPLRKIGGKEFGRDFFLFDYFIIFFLFGSWFFFVLVFRSVFLIKGNASKSSLFFDFSGNFLFILVDRSRFYFVYFYLWDYEWLSSQLQEVLRGKSCQSSISLRVILVFLLFWSVLGLLVQLDHLCTSQTLTTRQDAAMRGLQAWRHEGLLMWGHQGTLSNLVPKQIFLYNFSFWTTKTFWSGAASYSTPSGAKKDNTNFLE